MASPRVARRKISLPILRTPAKSRKNSCHGNRLDIDHLNAQSHIAFLRKVSVNPHELMYPITLILPNEVRQAIVVPSTSKLKNVLEEVKELLSGKLDEFTLEGNSGHSISLNSPAFDFVGRELKVVKKNCLLLTEKKETTRLQLVKDLCASEKQFRDRLHQADVVYKQPLRNWGLDEAELCLLFDGTTKVEETSCNLINKLEGLIIDWNDEESCVAEAFSESFWQTHEKYPDYYELAKLTLKSKNIDPSFRNFINMQRSISANKPTIQALILGPKQRVPQYDGFISELSLATKSDHKDKRGIELALSRMHQLSDKRSEDLQKEELEFKIIQVQEKFPNDKLDLDLSWQEYDRLKTRRYNSPNLRLKKPMTEWISFHPVRHHLSYVVQRNIQDAECDKKTSEDVEKSERVSPTPSLMKRLYIQEGPVKLSSNTTTNERYLFLFNDLLLVAKQKSVSTFKLKERIRVSDIWIASCIDDVTDNTVPQEKSFVIGWPTTNYVASFHLAEEKEIWYNALQKSINDRRECEEPKEVNIKVANKTQATEEVPNQTCSVPITFKDDARSVVKTSLSQFQCPNEDPNDFQLFVLSKDGAAFPLIGHEIPFAIRMSNYRMLHEYTHDENDNQYDHTTSIDDDGKLQFHLKKAKKGNNRLSNDINAQKKRKNIIKNINWNKNKKASKPSFNHQESMPPGKLFGNPLVQLSTEEDMIPKPIEDLLHQLFRKGPGTTGIFRKSALQRTAREIRHSLDAGKEVDFFDKSAVVLATVLKDFFRSLPDSLIVSDHYDGLVATKLTTDSLSRVQEIKKIISSFPKVHYELMMRFLCALYHIQRFCDRNNMTAYNLSICVSPSIMWPPANSKLAATEQATGSSDVVCFLIDNYIDIFSKDNEYLLGGEGDIQLDDGPGEDSDSGTDQVIYRYGDADERDDSEKENEPPTPDFLLSPVGDHENVFSQSDSSLNTNDSDELKTSINSKLSIPSISLKMDTTNCSSHSTPSSPLIRRRDAEKAVDKISSDVSDQEIQDHDHFKRKLLRQHKPKRVLSSTTASAELIEHKRIVSDSVQKTFKKVDLNEVGMRDDSFSSIESFSSPSRSSTSLTGSVIQKHTISQPTIQHFATDYRSTPNIIFHAVDRRRLPAAPSYEEHIQRTQQQSYKSKTVQSVPRRQPIVVSHTTLVQHQSSPVRPKKLSNVEPGTVNVQKLSIEERPDNLTTRRGSLTSITSRTSVEERSLPRSCTSSPDQKRVGHVTRQPRVSKDDRPSPRSPRSQPTSPKHSGVLVDEKFFSKDNNTTESHKLSEEEDTMIKELLENLTTTDEDSSTIKILDSSTTSTHLKTNTNCNDTSLHHHNKETHHRSNSKDAIEMTFNSMLNSLNHNVELNGKSNNNNNVKRSHDIAKSNSFSSSISSSVAVSETQQQTSTASPRQQSNTNVTKSNHCTESIGEFDETDMNISIHVESQSSPSSHGEINNEDFASTDRTSASPRTAHRGPFTLTTLKSDCKTTPLNSLLDDSKSQSLSLEKTLLTKAPKKIDQLTNKSSDRKDDGRIITAREMRRTNRKLKSEIRNAFHDGFTLPPKDRTLHATNTPTFNIKYNGIIANSEVERTLRQRNKENYNKNRSLHASQFSERNNNSINTLPPSKPNTDSPFSAGFYKVQTGIIANDEELQQDEEYAKIMSQAESYV